MPEEAKLVTTLPPALREGGLKEASERLRRLVRERVQQKVNELRSQGRKFLGVEGVQATADLREGGDAGGEAAAAAGVCFGGPRAEEGGAGAGARVPPGVLCRAGAMAVGGPGGALPGGDVRDAGEARGGLCPAAASRLKADPRRRLRPKRGLLIRRR